MRLSRLAPLALMMFAACGGDDDDNNNNGPGDVAAVFPGSGFIGRKLRVEVSGDTTSWAAGTTVSFGAGVTVDKVELASPQALFADITIAPTAPAGKVDVTVTSGTDTLTLPASFELQAPVSVEAAADFEQGGLSAITITNKDLLNPFDTTQNQQGDFTGVTVASTDPGVTLTVSNVTTDTITLNALIDVNATTTGDITVTSGTVVSPVPAVAVTARAPQVVTNGTAANFTVTPNGALLQVTADAAGMLNLRLTTADMQMASNPGFALLPASGKWSDLIVVHENFGDTNADAALDNRVVAAGDKFYVVALELGIFGAPGYQATVNTKTISLTGVTAVTDTGDNATPATAQALTGTVSEFDGTLTDKTDVDCFKVTTVANKKIHVYTTDADGTTDSVVEVFGNSTQTDRTTPAPINASTDADLGEEVVTANLVAPLSRAICVSASQFAPDALANAAYKAFVVIE